MTDRTSPPPHRPLWQHRAVTVLGVSLALVVWLWLGLGRVSTVDSPPAVAVRQRDPTPTAMAGQGPMQVVVPEEVRRTAPRGQRAALGDRQRSQPVALGNGRGDRASGTQRQRPSESWLLKRSVAAVELALELDRIEVRQSESELLQDALWRRAYAGAVATATAEAPAP